MAVGYYLQVNIILFRKLSKYVYFLQKTFLALQEARDRQNYISAKVYIETALGINR